MGQGLRLDVRSVTPAAPFVCIVSVVSLAADVVHDTATSVLPTQLDYVVLCASSYHFTYPNALL